MPAITMRAKGEIFTALVDEEDFVTYGALRWYPLNGYASRRHRGTTVYLHRQILGLEPGDKRQCDHINRDRLDNRRSNLRIVTQAQNLRNLGSQRGSTSQYRGVWFRADKGKWGAQARLGETKHSLGTFTSEHAAAEAVNAFWLEHGYEAPNEVVGLAA